MADNFSEQRAFIQAAEAYRKALESPVVPPGTHANYGFVLLNRQDLAGAKREVNAELKTDPGSLMAKFVTARLLIEEGATRQAAGEIQEIWNTDNGFFRANIARFKSGLARPKRSELESVLEEQSAAGTLSAEVVALFRDDAGSGSRDQNPGDQKAGDQKTITDAEPAASSKKSAGNNAARLYADGKYRQCRDSLAPRLPLLQASDLRLLARCAYSTGEYGQAFQAASKLAVSAPTEAEGLYWETRSAQALATKALRQASLVDSGSPTMHVLLGDFYRQRNAFHEAEQEYRKALVLAPRNTGALFGLSLTLLGNNQLDEAFQVAQSALANDAEDPELNAVMGEILCARDDFSGAEKYLKKSLNTKPEYVPHVHALLGTVYAKTNRTQEAIAELKLALASDKDGHIYYQIARLYLKTGDRDSAEKAFQVSEKLRGEGLNRAAVAIQQSQGDSESQ
jgi:predicted Zn-dependent protease